MFNIREIDYKNFGKCLEISNGIIKAVVTISIGPRILDFSFINGKNILFNDEGRIYQHEYADSNNTYGENNIFYFYGGHRLELVPRTWPKTMSPDNEPVVYSKTDDGILFIAPSLPLSEGIELSIKIIINGKDSNLMVVHNLKNNSNEQKIVALGGTTQLNAGGTLIIPQNKLQDEKELSPNKAISLWPYSKFDDTRIHFYRNFITLKQNPDISRRFKFGFNNQSGLCVYKKDNLAFVKNFLHNPKAQYPDLNSSFEAYTDENMLEVTSLSPLWSVAPNESIYHAENWTLKKLDSSKSFDTIDDIENFMKNL